jgi:hypothetical protein
MTDKLVAAGTREVPLLSEMLAEDPLAEWKAFYSLMVSAVPGLQGSEQYAFQFTNPERGADWWKEGQERDAVTLIDAKPQSSGAFYGPGVTTISDNSEFNRRRRSFATESKREIRRSPDARPANDVA